ncbi:MAG TPA: hypothetical protein VGL76_02925 [Gaiellaceae bacterium]|jgi:hypothetical protein
MPGFLNRLLGRYRTGTTRRDDEERQMSKRERAFARERVEDHAADELVDEHLGGTHPRFDDGAPRH